MAGLVPAIHVFLAEAPVRKTWMPATSAGMTLKFSKALPRKRRHQHANIGQFFASEHQVDDPLGLRVA